MANRNRARLATDVPASTEVRRRPSLDASVTGLVYCSMMMFMGLAAINSQANLLFGVFGLMIGILFVSIYVSRSVLRRMEIERILPELAIVGQPTTISYRFHNKKRFWPSLSLTLGELDGAEAFTRQPVSYLLHVAPKNAAQVPIEVMPKRRGMHQLDRFQLATSFPFGFIKRAIEQRRGDSILIYPALGHVDHRILAMCRSADTSGATMRPRQGGTDEFYGVKEHRQGDNPRWIYWRRSARTGVTVAKEMTQVSPPRLLLLLDTFVPERTIERHAGTERSIAMAASLASYALEAGLSVGLFTWSSGWLTLAPNRGKRHRRDLLAQLARLPLNVNHPAQALVDAARSAVTSGTTPVLLTPSEIQLGFGEFQRSGLIVLGSASRETQAMFRFGRSVDFGHSMPVEQQP